MLTKTSCHRFSDFGFPPNDDPLLDMVFGRGFDFFTQTAYFLSMAEKKKGANIANYWAQFTPEQAKQKREEQRVKRLKTMADKRNLKAEAYKKAQDFMPMAIANNLLEAENSTWIPDQITVNKVVALIQAGMSPEEIKIKVGASDKSWEKISKVIFNSIEPNVQDIGLQLYGARLDAVKAAKKMVARIEKEIKAHQKNQRLMNRNSKQDHIRKQRPTIPSYLLTHLAKATSDKLHAENEYAKILQMIGTHDKKNSAPTITIKTTIPRPGEQQVVEKVITTKRVSLEEAMAELNGP